MTEFPGLSHVALTVFDLETSVEWYRRVTDSDPVLDEDTGPFRHVVFALNGGALLGLHQFPSGETPSAEGRGGFDERRQGLDHVAFACADRAELEGWERHLDGLGVAHGGIVDAHYGSGLSFRDPDNIALEFFAPPS
ncbi:VOC family protein [Streptomyces sp. RKAG293]|uniref:VOC family protein n=1 Tax=Streptomyces sp. RKAG293 TaxID=2893403 RepID=UPI0020333AA1|nr:VOC family protein [Streptomyces sp. RKAG293]MCM2416532.1 VOC family protein [Streptomyces sp. RKAG293]